MTSVPSERHPHAGHFVNCMTLSANVAVFNVLCFVETFHLERMKGSYRLSPQTTACFSLCVERAKSEATGLSHAALCIDNNTSLWWQITCSVGQGQALAHLGVIPYSTCFAHFLFTTKPFKRHSMYPYSCSERIQISLDSILKNRFGADVSKTCFMANNLHWCCCRSRRTTLLAKALSILWWSFPVSHRPQARAAKVRPNFTSNWDSKLQPVAQWAAYTGK